MEKRLFYPRPLEKYLLGSTSPDTLLLWTVPVYAHPTTYETVKAKYAMDIGGIVGSARKCKLRTSKPENTFILKGLEERDSYCRVQLL